MKRLICLFPFVTACTAQLGDPDPVSVRDYLSRGDATLSITPKASAGVVTASQKVNGSWRPGIADLRIDGGTLALTADDAGVITIQDLALDIGPIRIPDSILGYGVELTDIAIGLVQPVKAVVVWSDDNEARGDATVDLSLAWSLVNHGTTSPLGSPDLPPVPVELMLTGTGDRVSAELRVHAPGTLWNWAGLFQLEDLSLILAAATE